MLRIVIVCLAISPFLAHADMFAKLYSNADSRIKPFKQINLSKGIIPLYQKGAWLKVAEPSTGVVGWLSERDIKAYSPQIVPQLLKAFKGPKGSYYRFVVAVPRNDINHADLDKRLRLLSRQYQLFQQYVREQMTRDKKHMRQFNQLMLMQQGGTGAALEGLRRQTP